MKHNGLIKSWNVIYPILIYYVVVNVVMSVAVLALGITEANYSRNYTMLQTIGTAVALPVLYGFYRKDQMLFTVFHQRTAYAGAGHSKRRKLLYAMLAMVSGALVGVVLNNIIGATGLPELSLGYQNVTSQFFGGSVLFEVIGIGILVPIVEELLYRGVVYARLSDWIGLRSAALISTLVFAGLHMNMVQFIYAFFMGFLLVYLLEQVHNIYGAILGHIGANLVTVWRTETECLNWMEESHIIYWVSTIVMAILCAGVLWFIRNEQMKRNEK